MAVTYESLRESFLKNISDEYDKREGTISYMLASAAAMATMDMYDYIDKMGSECYLDTATGANLERLCAIAGIERRGATKAVVKIEGGDGLRCGDKVATDDMSYSVISEEDGYFKAEADTAGSAANSYIGEVVAQERADITEGINIVSIIAKGEDEEDDESFRKRFVDMVKCPVCPGNVRYYKEMADSVSGIGGRRIIPAEEKMGVIRMIITDTDYEAASDELIDYVQEIMDPKDKTGLGYGLAPLGHKVTVESAEKVNVDIKVELEGVTTDAYYLRLARSKLPIIFKEINEDWDKTDYIVLRDRVIEDCFLELGVDDINVVSINGNANRLILKPNQILGDVSISGT